MVILMETVAMVVVTLKQNAKRASVNVRPVLLRLTESVVQVRLPLFHNKHKVKLAILPRP